MQLLFTGISIAQASSAHTRRFDGKARGTPGEVEFEREIVGRTIVQDVGSHTKAARTQPALQ